MIAKADIIINSAEQNQTMPDKKNRKWLWLLLPLVSLLSVLLDEKSVMFCGVAMFLLMLVLFYKRWGKQIPLLELSAVVSGFQWFICPLYVYANPSSRFYSSMIFPLEDYFILTVPAYACFVAGMMLFSKPLIFEDSDKNKTASQIIPILLAIGILGTIGEYVAASFIMVLCHNMLLTVLLWTLFRHGNKWYIILAASIIALKGILFIYTSAMFHTQLIMVEFLILYCGYYWKISWKSKTVITVLLIILIFAGQYYKSYMRDAMKLTNTSGVYRGDAIYYDDPEYGVARMIHETIAVRLNQGWIISRVYNHINDYNLSYGWETLFDTFKAVLLPRFLAPDKRLSGGRENMEKMAGYDLNAKTSMNVSLVGEGYACFGRYGLCIFMFCCGLVFSLGLNLTMIWEKAAGFGFFFIPVIFFNTTVAESDLLTVTNHAVKAALFLIILIWAWKSFNNREKSSGKTIALPDRQDDKA